MNIKNLTQTLDKIKNGYVHVCSKCGHIHENSSDFDVKSVTGGSILLGITCEKCSSYKEINILSEKDKVKLVTAITLGAIIGGMIKDRTLNNDITDSIAEKLNSTNSAKEFFET